MANSTTRRHPAMVQPLVFADRKRGIRQQPVRSINSACSITAGFMESVVKFPKAIQLTTSFGM
jgi:hypothetical protein